MRGRRGREWDWVGRVDVGCRVLAFIAMLFVAIDDAL